VPPSSHTPPRVGYLRCFTCGKTVECFPENRLRYTLCGWPRCCHDVMVLLIRDTTQFLPTEHISRTTAEST
jgi:hypothetical protein